MCRSVSRAPDKIDEVMAPRKEMTTQQRDFRDLNWA